MYTVRAVPENIHFGFYSAELKPILTVKSGDTVKIETSRCDILEEVNEPIKSEMAFLAGKRSAGGPGPHTLTGPIYIEGAKQGNVLEIQIRDIQLRSEHGVNKITERGILSGEYTEKRFIPFTCIDKEKKIAQNIFPGVSIPLQPFFGSLGVAPPPEHGRISSIPPGDHGGNMDINELLPGTTVYLPVHVKGALFSCGDGHACQADGEADGTGFETPLTGIFTFMVRNDMHLTRPRAESFTHFITIGFHKDLRSAAETVIRDMIDFLIEKKDLSFRDAYILVSLVGELHVSQLVNEISGVHFMLPKNVFE